MSPRRAGTAGVAIALALLSLGVAMGRTRALDLVTVTVVQSVASRPLDLVASLATVFGRGDVAAVIALAMAVAWWRREGRAGLAPLVLFVGVPLEIMMKHVVPHPGPPRTLWRTIDLFPSLRLAETGMSIAPYAFPSGHMLRWTFLLALVGARAPRGPAAALVGLVVLTGLMHVYLATHWVSDVVGGALAGWLLARLALAFTGARRP